MIYVIIYNPKDEMTRQLFRHRLMSLFSTGVSVKKDVFLVSESQESTPQCKFRDIVQQCTSNGDSVIVAPLDKGIGAKGYPESLKQWISNNIS